MNQPSLNEYQMRPRYKFSNERTAAELRSSLKQALSSDANWPLQYKDTHGHLIFSYKKKDRHTWSPEMDLNLEERPEGGTLIRVLIGPAAGIWTFFMFLYTICILIAAGSFVLSYSQYVLDKTIWGFWLLPIAVLGAVAVYLAGLYGKSRAIPQMIFLKKFFDAALPKSVLLEGDLRKV
ncbi:hypothetical protein [Croceimicrobium sp.]|uniref:hypothetical protein n=1 Tax=Croceimicrobium sp. TaxID=2828340 RepID=UPI003BACC093